MIKVVASRDGIPGVEQLIGEGINVNITLMFSQRHYEEVAQAYLRGLERAASPPDCVGRIIFREPIDTVVDRALEENGSSRSLGVARERLLLQMRRLLTGAFVKSSMVRPFGASRAWRSCAACALGEHGSQESELPRCSFSRRAHWAGYGQHHSAGDAASFRQHGTVRGATCSKTL